MKLKDKLKGVDTKNLLGIGAAIVTGVIAFVGAVNDQKKEHEFEEMKKTLSELKGK